MKKLICLLMIILICLNLCACGSEMEEINDNNQSSMFVKIGGFRTPNMIYDYVVFHKDTKVMYIISYDGIATVMVDAEGKPLLYEEDVY